MVTETARRADDDVATPLQGAPLGPRVHPADAGQDRRPGSGVEPGQLAGHLKGQLPRGRNDQGGGRPRLAEAFGETQQGGGHGEAKGDGLARPGLGGDQQIAVVGSFKDLRLDGRGLGIAAFGKRAVKRRVTGREGHGRRL